MLDALVGWVEAQRNPAAMVVSEMLGFATLQPSLRCYSYTWAEVLSADAFAAFEETDFSPETGARFRDTVLAKGGSREAMELFIEFRGRKPSIEPLLRHSGLAAAA